MNPIQNRYLNHCQYSMNRPTRNYLQQDKPNHLAATEAVKRGRALSPIHHMETKVRRVSPGFHSNLDVRNQFPNRQQPLEPPNHCNPVPMPPLHREFRHCVRRLVHPEENLPVQARHSHQSLRKHPQPLPIWARDCRAL